MINSNKWTGRNGKIEADTLFFGGMAIGWPTLTIILVYLLLNMVGDPGLVIYFLSGLLMAAFPGFCISVHALLTLY